MPVVAASGAITPGVSSGSFLVQDDGNNITLDDGTQIIVLDNS